VADGRTSSRSPTDDYKRLTVDLDWVGDQKLDSFYPTFIRDRAGDLVPARRSISPSKSAQPEEVTPSIRRRLSFPLCLRATRQTLDHRRHSGFARFTRALGDKRYAPERGMTAGFESISLRLASDDPDTRFTATVAAFAAEEIAQAGSAARRSARCPSGQTAW
jgi:hypothetical protein